MKIPFQILGLNSDADDEAIKNAYLTGVKKYSPDQHPREFQRLRAAYEMIKTPEARLSFRLFAASLPDMDDLCDILAVAAPADKTGPRAGVMRKTLRENMKRRKLPVEKKDG
ncbi:MAG TPA: molecular chaperone DnaJ [Desulfobacterales bacterium]|nr:molecular chaperone DnaJ [Desulfobacterales bacterium]